MSAENPTTPTDKLAELRAKHAAMTPGKWEFWAGDIHCGENKLMIAVREHQEGEHGCPSCSDSAGIVAIVNEFPAMADVIAAAQALLRHLELGDEENSQMDALREALEKFGRQE